MKRLFVIVLSGPPSVGKNAIALGICKAYSTKTAEIDLDHVKEMVRDAPSTDYFLELASKVGQSMTRIYIQQGLNVVVHKAFCSYQFVKPFIEIARQMGASCAYFKLRAPLDELLERNRTRCRRCSEEDLLRIYNFDRECAHPEGTEIDTTSGGIDDVVKRIVACIEASPDDS